MKLEIHKGTTVATVTESGKMFEWMIPVQKLVVLCTVKDKVTVF